MARTRYGEGASYLPSNETQVKETRLSDRVDTFTCKTTDRATFVRRDSPFTYGTRWYILILFGRALMLEVKKG